MHLLEYYLENGDHKVTTDINIRSYLNDQTKKIELAEFIDQRLNHRYIKPFEYISAKKIKVNKSGKLVDEYTLLYKNGFSLMANSCLLIETLESFYQGLNKTINKSENPFL